MTRKRIDATTGKPVDFYARGRAYFDALDRQHVTQVPTMAPVPDIYAQFAAMLYGVDRVKPGTGNPPRVGADPHVAANFAEIEARMLAHYAKANPPVPITFTEMYGCGGGEVAAFRMAQAPDAPAELRDWFWQAVRRGCSDPDSL